MSEYEARIPEYHGEEWQSTEGYDYESAAAELAKEYNENSDYCLMNSSVYVLVREVGTEEIKIVSASAEPDVYYSSQEISEVKCRHCKKDCSDLIINGDGLTHDDYCSNECYLAYYDELRKEYK